MSKEILSPLNDMVFKALFGREKKESKIILMDEELREEYYAREKARLDRESSLYYAKEQGMEQGMEKGIEKGIEQGIEKGIEKEKLQTVRNALSEGLDIELIAKITGLSKEEIEKIKRQC